MLPKDVFCVTEDEKLLINKSHGKSEEEIKEHLEELKEWIITQPHIPQDQDGVLLGMVLQLNKFNMDKAKRKLDMFYAIRNIVPEFYNDRSPLTDQMQNIMKQFTITPLPQLLHKQQRLYMCRFLEATDTESFDTLTTARFLFLVYDLRIHLDLAAEEVFICDLQQMRFHHVLSLSPLVLTRMYSVLQKGYSDRIKGIHFVNVPRVANIFVALVKYILNFKLANRVQTHKNWESVGEKIPKECLPSNYGGSLKPIEEIDADWQNFMESKDEWLVEQGNKRTIEKLRPQKSTTPGMFNSILNIFRRSTYSNEAPL